MKTFHEGSYPSLTLPILVAVKFSSKAWSEPMTPQFGNTVVYKQARACYYILRDQVPFDVNRAFA